MNILRNESHCPSTFAETGHSWTHTRSTNSKSQRINFKIVCSSFAGRCVRDYMRDITLIFLEQYSYKMKHLYYIVQTAQPGPTSSGRYTCLCKLPQAGPGGISGHHHQGRAEGHQKDTISPLSSASFSFWVLSLPSMAFL